MLTPEALPKCFVDFFYGDALPNMKECRGNYGVYISPKELFEWLQDREELEYHPSSDASPYKARTTSRFYTSEFIAMFGSVLRHAPYFEAQDWCFEGRGTKQT